MSGKEKSGTPSGLPALTLMVLSPLIAEVLPGATRVSALFVFPLEVLIWGGGTVMVRYLARRFDLGWSGLFFLALALSWAEELLIQQTSVAPIVFKIQGIEYARAFDFNYVYFVWASLYEVVFVTLVPIAIVERIFPTRRHTPWLNGWGVGVISALFVPACVFAWFTWTQMARPKVFNMPAYDLPLSHAILGVVAVSATIICAFALRKTLAIKTPIRPPHPWVLTLLSALTATVVFGLLILAFGASPTFPPMVAVAIGLGLTGLLVYFVPRWMAHPGFGVWHEFAQTYGLIFANFALMFIAFQGATPLDFWGKVVLDIIGVVMLLWLMAVRTGPRVYQATSAD